MKETLIEWAFIIGYWLVFLVIYVNNSEKEEESIKNGTEFKGLKSSTIMWIAIAIFFIFIMKVFRT